jgi:hypothetical protein
MKKSLTILMTLVLLTALSAMVKGQNTVSLTSGGFIVVSGENPGTPLSMQSPSGKPISTQINFGDVSPSVHSSRRIIIKMPIRISATVNYKIEFQRISINDSSVKPSDIGFGITNIRAQRSGSHKLATNSLNITGAGNFLNDPAMCPIINGKPKFTATLNDISESPTLILSGVPTVNESDDNLKSESAEDLGKDETSILADLIFVVSAQYYDADKPFSLRLNMTISPQ